VTSPNGDRPKTELVLVGGGHSHVQVLRAFAMEPPRHTHLTVVVDRPVAIYSGMVPGFVAGQYRAHELEIDVLPLARRARARIIISAAVRIDADAKRVHFADRPPIPYDVASLDVGSTVAGLDLPGIKAHALPTRPIAELVQRTDALVARARDRRRGSPFRIVIVGGGAGGVELAFTLYHRVSAGTEEGIDVKLVHAWPEVLAGYPQSMIERVHANAKRRGIEILAGRRVTEATPEEVVFEGGERRPYEALVWVAGAVSHSILPDSGLPTEPRGFVKTRSTLQVEGHDDLFAVGDCGTLIDYPKTPKAGVYAVRQGPYLIENLRSIVAGRSLREYRPQSDFLTLLNLGDGTALGAKWGRSFEGEWVMRLKDWIDRKFMTRFQVLDESGKMTPEFAALPEMSGDGEMLCGGCAAKVGQSILDRALDRLEPRERSASDRLGLAPRDDAAAFRSPSGDLMVSSVDAFRAFFDDPFLVGQIAAVNAISDIYATGATPEHALALVTLPKEQTDEAAEEMLFQVLAGARAAFEPVGVSLLGGHTTSGPELFVGFSVDGSASSEGLLSLDHLTAGDKLILTKRLGTGVVLNADMKGRIPAPWLQSAIASMLQTNAEASRVAIELGSRAATDVTGFGLVGHLAEMVRASGTSAVIDMSSAPALPGAVELLGQGFRSTFHAQNEKAKNGIVIQPEASRHPKLELLFDPQTSGGLLFALPESRVREALDRLEGAVVIGEVTDRRPDGALVEVKATP
jgi:selenide,water dikinase